MPGIGGAARRIRTGRALGGREGKLRDGEAQIPEREARSAAGASQLVEVAVEGIGEVARVRSDAKTGSAHRGTCAL